MKAEERACKAIDTCPVTITRGRHLLESKIALAIREAEQAAREEEREAIAKIVGKYSNELARRIRARNGT